VTILDKNGRPLDATSVQLKTPHVIIEDLPPWCGGVLYKSADDVLMLRVQVPTSEYAIEHLLHLEMTPTQARAVLDALAQCLTRAESASKILDVDPPSTSD
jgi:hypothetical protein